MAIRYQTKTIEQIIYRKLSNLIWENNFKYSESSVITIVFFTEGLFLKKEIKQIY